MSTIKPRIFSTLALLATLMVAMSGCSDGVIFSIDPIVSSGAVLQQQSLVTISGRATPGTHIRITTDWDFSVTSSTGPDSLWKAQIRTPAADTVPHHVTVSTTAKQQIVYNIYIGEVWFAADQREAPNFPKPAIPQDSTATEIFDWLDDNLVRIFKIEKGASHKPTSVVDGKWMTLTRDSRPSASLSVTSLAKILQDSLRIPLGIISASNGCAPCRSWVSPSLSDSDDIHEKIDAWNAKHNELANWLSTLPTINIPHPYTPDALATTSVFDEVINFSLPDISEWRTMTLPGLWSNQGLPGFDGIVWLIKEVNLPRECAKHNAKLIIGNVADNDLTYVNQTLVGSKADRKSWSEPGVYNIPRSVLKQHTTIAIRLNGSHRSAGIFGPADGSNIRIEIPDIDFSADISGQWNYVAAAKFSDDKRLLYLMGVANNPYMTDFRGYDVTPCSHRGTVFNKVIAPLQEFPFAGAVCHFGEVDMTDKHYAEEFPSEIAKFVTSIRETVNNPYLPVIFNQPAPPTMGQIRTSLTNAVNNAGPNVYVVSLADLGPSSSFNTLTKQQMEEGKRDAKTILSSVYGHIAPANALCPIPRAATAEYQVVNVEFNNAKNLHVDTSTPSAFEIAGADSTFFPAKALASGKWVTLFSHMVAEPVYVRYAWADSIPPTLSGDDGMPAPAFCLRCKTPETDDK